MRHVKIIIALLIFSLKGISQTNIQLILKGDKKISKVYAQDFSFKESLDTTYKDTINFHFTKTNNIDLYNIGCFINGKQPWKQIWLDSGLVTIFAHLDSSKLIIDTVINSSTYDYVKKFNKDYSNIIKLKDTSLANIFLLESLNTNINNPFSLWIGMLYLNLNQNSENNIYTLKQSLAKQGNKFSWFRLYDDIIGRIDNVLNTKYLTLSDFKFIDKQKEIKSLSLKKADFYVLDFWFLGCLPCRKEHKIIAKNYKKLLKNKIEIIGISIDEYSMEWKDYIFKNRYNWTNYLQEPKNKITETLSIKGFPFYLIINGKGEILGRYNSINDVLKKLKFEE
jgi:thiol-disulfide isomerase/thioredoxin